MNYQQAKAYVAAYAAFQKIPVSEVFAVETGSRFRGNVYNVEFEYDAPKSVLIARGYIFHSTTGPLREDIWNKYQQIQRTPGAPEIRQLLPGARLDFSEKSFELDTTINEVEPTYTYRLNLRKDYATGSMSEDHFIKNVRKLAEEAIVWEKSYDPKIVDACNKHFFPMRAEYFIRSYAASIHAPCSIVRSDSGFSCYLNGIAFKFTNQTAALNITSEIAIVKDLDTDLNFYARKIKKDSSWYWRASVVRNGRQLNLLIKIGNYGQSEQEVIRIINHCVKSLAGWQKEL